MKPVVSSSAKYFTHLVPVQSKCKIDVLGECWAGFFFATPKFQKGLYNTFSGHYRRAMRTFLIVRSVGFAAICLLATQMPSNAQLVNIPVPNSSFDTSGPNFTGSPYADQTTIGFGYDSLPYGTGVGEPFNDWLTAAANYQIFSVSTTGDTGTFNGANAVQVNYNATYGYTLESLTPVVASIANNATYTLTFALANNGGGAGDVTLSMLTTTSAPNTFDYSSTAIGGNPSNGYYPATSPYPIITTVNTIASTTISGSTINGQAVGDFTDYSVSFDTLNGDNSASVGQDLTLALNVSNNSSLEFDNARLTELEVPEPGTWAMMFGGLSVLALLVRRRLTA
jgi:hypothetical protein